MGLPREAILASQWAESAHKAYVMWTTPDADICFSMRTISFSNLIGRETVESGWRAACICKGASWIMIPSLCQWLCRMWGCSVKWRSTVLLYGVRTYRKTEGVRNKYMKKIHLKSITANISGKRVEEWEKDVGVSTSIILDWLLRSGEKMNRNIGSREKFIAWYDFAVRHRDWKIKNGRKLCEKEQKVWHECSWISYDLGFELRTQHGTYRETEKTFPARRQLRNTSLSESEPPNQANWHRSLTFLATGGSVPCKVRKV